MQKQLTILVGLIYPVAEMQMEAGKTVSCTGLLLAIFGFLGCINDGIGPKSELASGSCSGVPGLAALARAKRGLSTCSAVRVSCGVFVTAYHCGKPGFTSESSATISTVDQTGSVLVEDWVPIDNPYPILSDVDSPHTISWNPAEVGRLRDLALWLIDEDCSAELPTVRLPELADGDNFSYPVLAGYGMSWMSNIQACSAAGGTCNFTQSAAQNYGAWLRSDMAPGSGDSGGPMLVGDLMTPNARPTILGVMSSATGGCTQETKPNAAGYGAYTNLLYAPPGLLSPVDFIRSEIAKRDLDGDGVIDLVDNCEQVPNAEQTDADHDGTGDLCELG